MLTTDKYHSVCRNSQCPKNFSLISMCSLWYGHLFCFSQLGYMHTKSGHWFPSRHLILVLPASWLEVHIFYLFIKHNQLHQSTPSWFGDQPFSLFWWKFKYSGACMSHYTYLTTAVLLVCISLDISRVSCKILVTFFPRVSDFYFHWFFVHIFLLKYFHRDW